MLTGIIGGIRSLGMKEYLVTCAKCQDQEFVSLKKNITEAKKTFRGMLWKCPMCTGNWG